MIEISYDKMIEEIKRDISHFENQVEYCMDRMRKGSYVLDKDDLDEHFKRALHYMVSLWNRYCTPVIRKEKQMIEVRQVTLEVKKAKDVGEVKQLILSYYTMGGFGKLTLYPEALLPCTNKRLKAILKMFKGGWAANETYDDFLTELIDTCLCLQEDLEASEHDVRFDIHDLEENGHPVTSATYNELIKIGKRKAYLDKNYTFLKERREKYDYC